MCAVRVRVRRRNSIRRARVARRRCGHAAASERVMRRSTHRIEDEPSARKCRAVSARQRQRMCGCGEVAIGYDAGLLPWAVCITRCHVMHMREQNTCILHSMAAESAAGRGAINTSAAHCASAAFGVHARCVCTRADHTDAQRHRRNINAWRK